MNDILPIGVPFAGKVHRDFKLRKQLVEDACLIYEDPAHGSRAEKNPYFAGVCLIARRLEKLGDIPRENITPDLLMKMDDEDMRAIQEADKANRGAPRPEPQSA